MTEQQSETYFEKARTWATESDHALKRSRKIAWIVASCAAGVAVVQALALLAILPLKETETVMLLVDRTTGYVQEIDPANAQSIRADDAMIQSLFAQYVTAREGYDRTNIQAPYRKAALWSAGSARQTYLSSMTGDGIENPGNRLRQREALNVEIKSVSQTSPGKALVRFDTLLTTQTGQVVRDGSWISTVDYHFSDAPMSYEDRLLNPLGLQVTRYGRNAERPPEERTVVAVPAMPTEYGSAP